jgi:histidinol phosphatase-like PHP family hydrolase
VPTSSLTNAQLSELLALESEHHPEGSNKQKALRRASRLALFWPEEAYRLVEQDRALTELQSVGPWVASVLDAWLTSDDPPEPVEPPPVRQGFLTLAEVRETLAPAPRWWVDDLAADLQMHTTYSDGTVPLREMAASAFEYGYSFVAVTDHSKGLQIANGMDEAELAVQGAEISRLNEELAPEGQRVLRSIEMDLSPEGVEDMEPASLASLDVVMGAFHSKLRLKDDQTDRYLAAMRNPHITTLAHPRGRIFNRRVGLWADWEKVFAEAAAQGKAVEIDANPNRQDLDVELLKLAVEAGCRISIGTDAHSVFELRFIEFGLALAIRAGVPRDRILNYGRADDVIRWSREIRGLA